MSLKKHGRKVNKDSSWQRRRADAFGKVTDGLIDVANAKKQKIADRIKSAGIKLKNVYKAKLGDDMRAFEYAVTKIDRFEGEVYLKNERNTIRKIRVFDKLFGAVARGRVRGQ
jgi:acyl CoA:acetate/3-ketoacid CoA transferase alpha subunit